MSDRKEIKGIVNEATNISMSRVNDALRVLQAYELQSSCKHDATIIVQNYKNPDNGDIFVIKQCTQCNKIIEDKLEQKRRMWQN